MMKSIGARAALAVGLCAGAASCQNEAVVLPGSAQYPIIGGQNVTQGEFPTVVAVSNNGLCTGTLIHPEWVLTAAHCIDPSGLGYPSQQALTNDTQVIFDRVNLFAGSGGFGVQAAQTIMHPGFNINALGDDDIGLIKLAQPVTDRTPTPINKQMGAAAPGTQLIQVGYGVSILGNDNSAGVLHKLTAPSTNCTNVGLSNSTLLCSIQDDGNGVCNGDSGGPAFVDLGGTLTVAGVASFVFPDCGGSGAHTRVDAEADFVEQHVGAVCVADGMCNMGCVDDPDCPDCQSTPDCNDPNKICENNECVALPFTPGGAGSTCTDSSQCDSQLCAGGPDGTMKCVELCTPGGSDCPNGFDCLAAGGGGACWPAAGGGDDGDASDGDDDGGGGPCGCRSGGHGETPAAGGLAMMLVVGVLALRRRRR